MLYKTFILKGGLPRDKKPFCIKGDPPLAQQDFFILTGRPYCIR